ncbi:ABC transporter substrate-binding protein [Microbacterium alcoholitolerans]|uniref:ABC transporter substrate-binding protein n=1 Tax=unclassified Microbacterium TaxID=2609290 RepID=UPI003D181B6E
MKLVQNTKSGGLRRAGKIGAISLAVALTLSACGSDGANNEGSSAGGGDGWAAGTYKIGVQALLSGPASFAGIPVANGAELAVEEINASGALGEGVTLELDVKDAGGDFAKAVSIANDFVRDDDVYGVICCTISGEAGAVRSVLQSGKLPTVTAVALLDGMNEPPYLYRVALLPGTEGQGHDQLVDQILAAEDIKTAVIANTADSQGQVAEFDRWKEKLESEGVEVVRVVETFIADRDFTGPATTIAELDPDLFLAGMYGDTGALMIDAVRDRGYDGTIISNFGISGENAYKLGGDSMDGAVFPAPFFDGIPNENAQKFIENYTAKFDQAPDTFAVNGYMAAYLIAQGFLDATEFTREGVAQAMANVSALPDMPVGMNGLILENGQATIEEYFMVTWDDGNTVLWNQ